MPTMKNREDLISELNAKSKADHVNSFAQSKEDRSKDQAQRVIETKTTKEKFVPSKGGVMRIDKSLYDAGV